MKSLKQSTALGYILSGTGLTVLLITWGIVSYHGPTRLAFGFMVSGLLSAIGGAFYAHIAACSIKIIEELQKNPPCKCGEKTSYCGNNDKPYGSGQS